MKPNKIFAFFKSQGDADVCGYCPVSNTRKSGVAFRTKINNLETYYVEAAAKAKPVHASYDGVKKMITDMNVENVTSHMNKTRQKRLEHIATVKSARALPTPQRQ